MTMRKTYHELIRLQTFDERFEYLKLCDGIIGNETFGYSRYINQAFYGSSKWRELRHHIIVRDNSCDLGVEGYDIFKKPLIHHIVPVTREQLLDGDPLAWDPENLITCSFDTHNAIHFGNTDTISYKNIVERTPFDTCPWKKG